MRGSSPRVRGKPSMKSAAILAHGLIPARAGKTTAASSAVSSGGAHPRACGENSSGRPRGTRGAGSSPRVRGKREVDEPGRPGGGLIPARAGKTGQIEVLNGIAEAHPRACGENSLRAAPQGLAAGSSPRVRGKRWSAGDLESKSRLIPARAGKTSSTTSAAGASPAHPRACGENDTAGGAAGNGRGSSPRVRGKRYPAGSGGDQVGLIPARAGKTDTPSHPRCSSTAHPRACGENVAWTPLQMASQGSSPRVRGKPLWMHVLAPCSGLIPARAGKTRGTSRQPSARRAHPRACGEN